MAINQELLNKIRTMRQQGKPPAAIAKAIVEYKFSNLENVGNEISMAIDKDMGDKALSALIDKQLGTLDRAEVEKIVQQREEEPETLDLTNLYPSMKQMALEARAKTQRLLAERNRQEQWQQTYILLTPEKRAEHNSWAKKKGIFYPSIVPPDDFMPLAPVEEEE